MAACGGYSSESESDEQPNPTNKITGKSFSIENLLAKTQPNSYIRWERNQNFLTDFTPKQVCPVPSSILVPSNLFRRSTTRRNFTSDSTTAPNTQAEHLLQGGDAGDDSDHNTDGDANALQNDEDGESLVPGDEESPRYKKKRPRTAFSVPQIRTLEAEFERNRYLTGSKRKELSKQLKLSETQIKIWFQNRRTKLKRKNVSEMETWVQQLYSPLGPMAPRPLVIGDRLYLFNNPGADVTPPPSYFSVSPVFDAWRQGPTWS